MQMADRLTEHARGHRRLSAAQVGQIGLRQIAELTGRQPEGVTGVEPGQDGWIVSVEVVEDPRVPSSADILATYETEFDLSGELLSYRRVRRYARGRGDSGGGSLWLQATWYSPDRGRLRSTDRA
jgi:hypothetical protein